MWRGEVAHWGAVQASYLGDSLVVAALEEHAAVLVLVECHLAASGLHGS